MDIRGRKIDYKIGHNAFEQALHYLEGNLKIETSNEDLSATKLFPVPCNNQLNITSNDNGQMAFKY